MMMMMMMILMMMNRIIDEFGRERIFHGENVVMKTTPFVPITSHFDAR